MDVRDVVIEGMISRALDIGWAGIALIAIYAVTCFVVEAATAVAREEQAITPTMAGDRATPAGKTLMTTAFATCWTVVIVWAETCAFP